jgi:hypothetical protein
VGSSRYLEVRYDRLVAEPEETIREICAFADLPFEPAMLDYAGSVDVSSKPHQQRLKERPTTGVRNWRVDMAPNDEREFERVAGDVLAELGYELLQPRFARLDVRSRAALASYRARLGVWNAVAYGIQRSPLWPRRHPTLV